MYGDFQSHEFKSALDAWITREPPDYDQIEEDYESLKFGGISECDKCGELDQLTPINCGLDQAPEWLCQLCRRVQ